MLNSKKLVSMLLAVVMMLSMGSLGVFAEETAETGDYEGVLSNGIRYTIHYDSTENTVEPMILPHWEQTVKVPFINESGTSGVTLGGMSSFVPAPHKNLTVKVIGALPDSMPTVNVGLRLTNGAWNDWITLREGGSVTFQFDGYESYSFICTASTSELVSASARFRVYSN